VLVVIGDLLEDIVVRTAAPPATGTDTPATIERRSGGSAANVAAAAASIGAAVRLICRVGVDRLGEHLVAELAGTGVDVRAQREGRTGSVVVLVDRSGERTMLPDRGAAGELRDIDPAWLAGTTWLHVPAYSLLSEPIGQAAMDAIGDVRDGGGSVSVDVSSVAVVEAFGRHEFASLLDRIAPAVVFANGPESALVPRDRGWVTVVKNGPDPVTVDVPGAPPIAPIPVPRIASVADTTGAGDAFAAGYITAAMNGAEVDAAVRAGIELARTAVVERSASRTG
jgi:sugar/nucleoside kinase (ribokinase family)